MWYVHAVGIRRHHPDWLEIESDRLDDGRLVGVIRVSTSPTDIVEIVLPLALLGQLAAGADNIRQTAASWG